MKFLIEKILINLFILSLKTKRIMRSAVSGKLNYYAKIYIPFVVGFLVVIWALFAFYY